MFWLEGKSRRQDRGGGKGGECGDDGTGVEGERGWCGDW